jgi:hypothetical protein
MTTLLTPADFQIEAFITWIIIILIAVSIVLPFVAGLPQH